MPDNLALTPSPPPPPPPVLHGYTPQLSASLPILQAVNVPEAMALSRSFSQPALHAPSLLSPAVSVASISPGRVASPTEYRAEHAAEALSLRLISQSIQDFSREPPDTGAFALETNDPLASTSGVSPAQRGIADAAAQPVSLPQCVRCDDPRARSQALRALREGFNQQKPPGTESPSHARAKEFLDDLIEFPEMVTESDLMLKISDKNTVVALLAANRQHHSTGIPAIELFISHASHSESLHLLRTAIDQLRPAPDSPVWIKLEGTHLSEAQLRGYGFKNAPDEDYMVLSEALRVRLPLPRRVAAARPSASAPPEVIAAHAQINRYLLTEKQPDLAVYQQDVALLPQVIDNLNQRKPGLNLAYLASIGEVSAALDALNTGTTGRFLLRSCQAADHEGTLHHLVVEACRDNRNRLSVIMLDSVTVDAQELGHRDLTRSLLHTHPEASLCFIGTGVQRSPYDCIPYSLDIASKCYQHQPLLQQLHQSLLARQRITGRSGREYRSEEGIVMVHPHFAGDILHASFFKHMSSTRLMNGMLSRYPALDEVVVNKQGERVSQRQRRQVATHTASVNGEEKKLTYNASIEHKRLRNISKLLQP